MYRRVLAVEAPDFNAPIPSPDFPFWHGFAPEVERHFAAKRERLKQTGHLLSSSGEWDRLRETLRPMLRAPERIRDCLSAAGAAWRAQDLGMSRDRVLAAFLHAHENRSRYTILDLAWLLGVLPGAAGEIVEEWA